MSQQLNKIQAMNEVLRLLAKRQQELTDSEMVKLDRLIDEFQLTVADFDKALKAL